MLKENFVKGILSFILICFLAISPIYAQLLTPSSYAWGPGTTQDGTYVVANAFDGNTATYAAATGYGSIQINYASGTNISGCRIYTQGWQNYWSISSGANRTGYTWYDWGSIAAGSWNNKTFSKYNFTTFPAYINADRGGWPLHLAEIECYGTIDIPPDVLTLRILNTDIYTNVTLNPSNVSFRYNDGIEDLWVNQTATDGDINDMGDTAMREQTIKVCSDATGYPQICTNNFIPANATSVIIWQKLVPSTSPFPTPTLIGNVSTNITSQNLTEPLVLPKFTLINKSLFRDQITNNSIIGNYTYGITSFMDELGDAVNQTVQDSIEFIDVPFDFLIDIQAAAHNLYLALFIPLIPFTYLPLLVTTKVVAVIPWQIQSLISMGLLVDLFYLMIRGSGGT